MSLICLVQPIVVKSHSEEEIALMPTVSKLRFEGMEGEVGGFVYLGGVLILSPDGSKTTRASWASAESSTQYSSEYAPELAFTDSLLSPNIDQANDAKGYIWTSVADATDQWWEGVLTEPTTVDKLYFVPCPKPNGYGTVEGLTIIGYDDNDVEVFRQESVAWDTPDAISPPYYFESIEPRLTLDSALPVLTVKKVRFENMLGWSGWTQLGGVIVESLDGTMTTIASWESTDASSSHSAGYATELALTDTYGEPSSGTSGARWTSVNTTDRQWWEGVLTDSVEFANLYFMPAPHPTSPEGTYVEGFTVVLYDENDNELMRKEFTEWSNGESEAEPFSVEKLAYAELDRKVSEVEFSNMNGPLNHVTLAGIVIEAEDGTFTSIASWDTMEASLTHSSGYTADRAVSDAVGSPEASDGNVNRRWASPVGNVDQWWKGTLINPIDVKTVHFIPTPYPAKYGLGNGFTVTLRDSIGVVVKVWEDVQFNNSEELAEPFAVETLS